MAIDVPSQQDLYDLMKNEIQTRAPQITDFEDGSIADSLAGIGSVGGNELLKVLLQFFAKTYFSTANGPEITGNDDDLAALAVDHFGSSFARPAAVPAVGTVTFSRPTATAGNVVIPVGTIVKTDKDADGNEQRFKTTAAVTMVALSIEANVEAVVAGADGNVGGGSVVNIEDSLTDDTVVVTNALTFAGGANQQSDAEYREFIRNKVEIIRGATKAAIEAAAVNVSGVQTATAIETLQTVIEWDIGGSAPIGVPFVIPRVKLYVADSSGTASAALIALVEAAILEVRACGVRIEVIGATPFALDWSASLSLNPSGPNFATLSTDTEMIVESMRQYIQTLPIGTGFNRNVARAAILAIWGSSGTNDLTDFTNNLPTGDIVVSATQKLIDGTVTA